MSKLNFARIIYDSEGGMGEAYYAYDGRVWARWETDFPEGDDNFSHRLAQLTRIQVNRDRLQPHAHCAGHRRFPAAVHVRPRAT